MRKEATELTMFICQKIVILGNVLCEVKDPTRFLHDVDRVLRPGGKVIFQEHIREAPGTVVGKSYIMKMPE